MDFPCFCIICCTEHRLGAFCLLTCSLCLTPSFLQPQTLGGCSLIGSLCMPCSRDTAKLTDSCVKASLLGYTWWLSFSPLMGAFKEHKAIYDYIVSNDCWGDWSSCCWRGVSASQGHLNQLLIGGSRDGLRVVCRGLKMISSSLTAPEEQKEG